MESRFGIDLNSLSNILKSGVTSQSKVKEICSHLHTSSEGLPSFPAHISLRQNTYGKNELSSLYVDRQCYSMLLKKSLVDFEPRFIRNIAIILAVVYLLLISGTLVLYSITHENEATEELGGLTEKILSLVTLALDSHCIEILIAVFVESALRYRKQGKLKAFLERLVSSAEKPLVKRDGNLVPVPLEDIVVGDICHVKPGDIVPGDGLLLFDTTKDVKFKSDVTSNEGVFCSAGSLVSEGTGVIMIVAVGPNTQISYLVNEPYAEKKLFNSSFILYFAILMATLIFLIPLMRFSITVYIIERSTWQMRHFQSLVTFFVSGLSAIGTLIPWLLPLVIILSLYNAQRAPGPLSKASVTAVAVSNVLKFLQFIFVVNIILATSHLILRLSSVQRVWIYLSTNILAVALFPTDTPKLEESKGVQKVSQDSNNKIPECVKNIIGQAFLQITILLILATIGPQALDIDSPINIKDPNVIQTMYFTTVALMSYCNLFHCRKIRDERDNHERNICSRMLSHPKSTVLIVFMVSLQVVIVEMGGLAFSSHPLNLQQWLCCIFCALFVLLWSQVLMSINASKLVCCGRKSDADHSTSRAAIYVDNAAESSV